MHDLTPLELLIVVNAYGLLALAMFALSASDFVYSRPTGARGARRHRLLKSMVALPLIVSCLGLLALGVFAIGMGHGSGPKTYQVVLFLLGCLLPVVLLLIWSFGSLWLDALWMLLVMALLGYVLFFNPAIYVRYWAESNIAWAQMWMARHYETGEGGLVQSKSSARNWYQSAAENGHRHAQYQMAATARQSSEALKWYLLAAQQGHAGAMVQLARAARSANERQRWLQGAVDANEPEAIFMLAQQAMKSDLPRARRLLLDAAELGSRTAIVFLLSEYQHGGLLFDQDAAAARHWSAVLEKTPASLLEPAYLSTVTIEQRTIPLPTTGADPRVAELDTLYQRAQSFLRHPAKDQILHDRAVGYLTRAATQGHAAAALELATLALHKAPSKRLSAEALSWYEMAASNGSQQALQTLVRHYKDTEDADLADLEKSLQFNARLVDLLQADNNIRQRLTLQHWAGEYRDTQKRLAQMARLGGSRKIAEARAAASPDKEYLLARVLLDERQYDAGMQRMRSAAQRGSRDARLELAAQTLQGPRSFSQEVEAISELQALDQAGFAQASLRLASIYQSATGLVPRNYYLARQMLRKAQADPALADEALRWLTRIPAVTDSLIIDAGDEPPAKIDAWYQQASARGLDEALLRQQREALLAHFSAIDALVQHAASDGGTSQYQLAQTLQSHDLAKAMQWLQRAAESGDGAAQYELAVRMIRGKKNSAEQQQALKHWAITAADGGHVGAQVFVAAQYKTGYGGFEKNAKLAKAYYRQALQSSDAELLYAGKIAGRAISIKRSSIAKALAALSE